MRIYAVADIHGKAERLSLVRKILQSTTPDVLIVAGDITGYIRPVPTIEALSRMPVPVIAIRGNTDMPIVERLLERYPNISHAHLNKILVKDRWFTGISGTIPVPFRSRFRFNETKMIRKSGETIDTQSILIVHPPPWGILDKVLGKFHAGSTNLLKLLKEKQPALCICGHIHEMPGHEMVGSTLVVNCSIGRGGAGSLIEINQDGTINTTPIRE